MNTGTRTRNRIGIALTAVVLFSALIIGCREAPGPGPGDEPGDEVPVLGLWAAEDTAAVFGRTLVTRIEIEITESAVSLQAVTAEDTDVVHRVTASGTYTLTETEITFAYAAGQQSTDLGDGTFDSDELVDLDETDLADFAVDFLGARSYQLTDTTFTVNPGEDDELEFTKQATE